MTIFFVVFSLESVFDLNVHVLFISITISHKCNKLFLSTYTTLRTNSLLQLMMCNINYPYNLIRPNNFTIDMCS